MQNSHEIQLKIISIEQRVILGKDGNIEYGNFEKKTVTLNRCYPNSKIETDPKWTRNGPEIDPKRTPHGVGWGVGWGGG